jgi:hypothetical protein
MIIYTDPDTGNLCQCSKASSVPDGVQYIEVDQVPDRTNRNAWKIENGQVVEDAVRIAEIEEERKDNAVSLLTDAGMSNFDKAFALLMLQEINVLRTALSMPEYTVEQLKAAVRNKL